MSDDLLINEHNNKQDVRISSKRSRTVIAFMCSDQIGISTKQYHVDTPIIKLKRAQDTRLFQFDSRSEFCVFNLKQIYIIPAVWYDNETYNF